MLFSFFVYDFYSSARVENVFHSSFSFPFTAHFGAMHFNHELDSIMDPKENENEAQMKF